MQTHTVRGSWPFPGVAPRRRAVERPSYFGFVINGNAGLGSLAELYGFKVPDAGRIRTFADYVAAALAGSPRVGDCITVGSVEFTVLALEGGAIEKIGLRFGRRADAVHPSLRVVSRH